MKPLVSCICITADRRDLVRGAIASYLSQDWDRKQLELVVLDDGEDEVRDLCEWLPNATYIRLATKQRIGLKRNLACEAAAGEILIHWDDDDWSAASRISDQVARMIESGKAVSGYNSLLFWDGTRGFRYQGAANYSLGTALCFTKAFWRQNPFQDGPRIQEDNVFVTAAQSCNQIVSVDGREMMVARIHPRNTSPKPALENPRQWIPVDRARIPAEFFEAIAC